MTGSDQSDIVGPFYFDASALVKLYVPSQYSYVLNRDFAGRKDLVLSELSITEVTSAICRLRREGDLTQADINQIHRRLLLDVAKETFENGELTSNVHRDAEKRLLASEEIELRAADALHLELALASRCQTMVTYDRRLAEASRRHGLVVYPD
jgi:predicted nucleic acid-binding protein